MFKMMKPQKFLISFGVLCHVFIFFNLYFSPPQFVHARSLNAPESTAIQVNYQGPLQQKNAQTDSLLREIERLKATLNSELRINHMRIEALQETTNRFFWAFTFWGALFGILGCSFILLGWYREKQYHREYQQERSFYQQRTMQYEKRLEDIHNHVLRILDKNSVSHVSTPIDQAYERYAILIDKKFQQLLKREEQLELETLEDMFDKAEGPYYGAIIQRLTAERDKTINKRSQIGEN